MKRSCFSDDCAIRGSNTVVLAWTRPWKSSCSLEKVGRSIPEEDTGEQIGPTKKVIQFEAGQSMQKHVQLLTKIFDELSITGDPLDEENQVVHLLASLSESYDMFVTVLEASPEVPKLEIVTERLLHKETKQRDKESSTIEVKPMTSKHRTSINVQSVAIVVGLGTSKGNAECYWKVLERIKTTEQRVTLTKGC